MAVPQLAPPPAPRIRLLLLLPLLLAALLLLSRGPAFASASASAIAHRVTVPAAPLDLPAVEAAYWAWVDRVGNRTTVSGADGANLGPVAAVSLAGTADSTITVAKDGGGNYRTIQAAVDAVPKNNKKRVVIRIGPGTFK